MALMPCLPLRPLLAVPLAFALCAAAPGRAQVVQFLDVPGADEILEALAGQSGGGRDLPRFRSGQAARVIRDEPALTPAPAAGPGGPGPAAAAPRPPQRRPAGAGALAFSDNFAPNSTRLPSRTVALLDNTAEAMRRAADITVLISGHTDANGNAVGNAILSLGRAEAAAQHLLLRGIEPARIVVTGVGSSQPLPGVEPTAPDNRRIQIAVASRPDRP